MQIMLTPDRGTQFSRTPHHARPASEAPGRSQEAVARRTSATPSACGCGLAPVYRAYIFTPWRVLSISRKEIVGFVTPNALGAAVTVRPPDGGARDPAIGTGYWQTEAGEW